MSDKTGKGLKCIRHVYSSPNNFLRSYFRFLLLVDFLMVGSFFRVQGSQGSSGT